MAMTKKERAEFDAAIRKAKLLAALRWTDPVAKDLPAPKQGLITGFECNAYQLDVKQYWSESFAHGRGTERDHKYGSTIQGGISLCSTKLLALRALRHAIECDAADKLLKIDLQIEDELMAAEVQGRK